ncbi:MAG TPA: hypothetical protein VLS28_07685, partial [Candidatus Sulfomarinibacteraceae bacterium]|nr:hypothetical protein [Candidatus Sulfomarinibacteraceae bacterium]
PITEPEAADAGPPDPGDRPPAGRLARPPSDRYARTATGGATGDGADGVAGGASAWRALAPAIVAALLTAAAFVLVGGVLAERRGLLAIAGLGGAVIGLLTARAAVSADGIAPPALSRGGTTKAAIALAMLAVLAGALGTWAYGRLEGGVMDPLAYLWEVLGPFVPVEAALAGIAAAWGAGAGPIRGRS